MFKPRYILACCIVVLTPTLCPRASAQVVDRNGRSVAQKVVSPAEIPQSQNVLYGAAYYNEYMPGDQAARLDKDVALMKAAGLNVVRMGESTWSLGSPKTAASITRGWTAL